MINQHSRKEVNSMLNILLEGIETFVNAILKAVQDFLGILGINVNLGQIDIGEKE